ncbi:glycosyltransferase [Arsenicicoccus piscis]|uniref:Glycosyl transferase family 1 n=1 Tax=Arsenicicoccus piscis TaxID=673954 RepID=A0ABQ6HU72_9MICO|nr:glycosyltransferase [Arsenicicoccus piscis]MCH8626453.1 glycosyltransferase [Arsenicicoccus piscis]GMA21079.1 glycosyl transferase family 1 [Arsenicicoccus piscis]
MRIALVAHGHHPIVEPYAGGLESFTGHLSQGLRSRGHHVVLYAAEGTSHALADELVTFERSPAHLGERLPLRVPGAPDLVDRSETLAYLGVVSDIADRGRGIDVVVNHTLQPTVLALSRGLGPGMVVGLHTPALHPVLAAAALADPRTVYTAVSAATAQAWATLPSPPRVIRNGVDPALFRAGPGGDRLVWVGRMTPEKGPELAIAAARRAGLPLDLIGPISAPGWFARVIAPRLGPDVRHLGPLDQQSAAKVVGASSVCLVTPRWEEPFGLVAAEALMCGTPVVTLDRGGVGEVVGLSGVRVPCSDAADHSGAEAEVAAALARAIPAAARMDRSGVRADALRRLSLDRMLDQHEELYAEVAGRRQRPSVWTTSPSRSKAASQPSIGHTPQR